MYLLHYISITIEEAFGVKNNYTFFEGQETILNYTILNIYNHQNQFPILYQDTIRFKL
jgi:hypothetical protein